MGKKCFIEINKKIRKNCDWNHSKIRTLALIKIFTGSNEKSVFHENNNFETFIWNILIFKVNYLNVWAHKNKLHSVKRKKN